jgi:hypothetical protein
MSINGISWETDLSPRQKYNTSEQSERREGMQEGQPEAGVMAKNNGRSWVERMGKEVKAALLATSYALTSTNM